MILVNGSVINLITDLVANSQNANSQGFLSISLYSPVRALAVPYGRMLDPPDILLIRKVYQAKYAISYSFMTSDPWLPI